MSAREAVEQEPEFVAFVGGRFDAVGEGRTRA